MLPPSCSTLPLLLPVLFYSLPISSAPTPASTSYSSAILTTNPFLIRSSSPCRPFNNLYLASYHTGAGLALAVLDPNITHARTWQLNGTATDFEYQITQMYSQVNGFPEGFVVRTTSGGEGTLEINAGEGSLGLYTTGQSIQVKSGEEVKLNDPQSGGWYACKKNLIYGPATQLFWKSKQLQKLPNGCADVVLKTLVKK